MIAKDGAAVRFALIYDSDPLNATAIGQVRALTSRLPALGQAAGLRGARYQVGGQTALTGDAINATASDLWRVGLTIVARDAAAPPRCSCGRCSPRCTCSRPACSRCSPRSA